MLNTMKLVNEIQAIDIDKMLKDYPAKAEELLFRNTTYSDDHCSFSDLNSDDKQDVIESKDGTFFFKLDNSSLLFDIVLDYCGSENKLAELAKKHYCVYDEKDKTLYMTDLFNDKMNAFNYFLSGEYGETAVAKLLTGALPKLTTKFSLHYNLKALS